MVGPSSDSSQSRSMGSPSSFAWTLAPNVDVISEQVYQQFLWHKAVQPARKILKGADKKPLSVIGFVKCALTKGDKSVQTDLYVIAGASSLLGCVQQHDPRCCVDGGRDRLPGPIP